MCVGTCACVCVWQGEKGDGGLMGIPGARGPLGPKVCEPSSFTEKIV